MIYFVLYANVVYRTEPGTKGVSGHISSAYKHFTHDVNIATGQKTDMHMIPFLHFELPVILPFRYVLACFIVKGASPLASRINLLPLTRTTYHPKQADRARWPVLGYPVLGSLSLSSSFTFFALDTGCLPFILGSVTSFVRSISPVVSPSESLDELLEIAPCQP